jgi:hypothetical protein
LSWPVAFETSLTQPLLVLTFAVGAHCGGTNVVAKTLVAAGVLLFMAMSAPASAQAPIGPQGPCPPGCDASKGRMCPQYCYPRPPSRPGPPLAGAPQQVYPQQVYPQQIYPAFVGLCVVPDVGTCEVFRAPGSYCECKNWLGEVFSGTVQ